MIGIICALVKILKMMGSRQDIAKAKEDYANECLKSAFEYESDVLEGKIIVSE